LRLGLSTSHPVHGGQLRKAVDALLEHVEAARVEPRLLELALGIAWLLASGRRTRERIENRTNGSADLSALASALGDEPAVRAHVDRLSPA
jgi:Ca-activated chloride channel family protein